MYFEDCIWPFWVEYVNVSASDTYVINQNGYEIEEVE